MVCDGVTCYANTETAYIRVDAALVPTTKNTIYRDATEKARTITGVRQYSQITNGEILCKAGITTNVTCGTVTGRGSYTAAAGEYPRYGQKVRVAQGIFTTAIINYGDSGGPLITGANGHNAYGIMAYFSDDTHSPGSKSYFSSVSSALTDMGLTLYVSAAC